MQESGVFYDTPTKLFSCGKYQNEIVLYLFLQSQMFTYMLKIKSFKQFIRFWFGLTVHILSS